MMNGGCVPGGIRRKIVCETAVTWAIAESMRTFGWKKMRITETPANVCDSMFFTLSTADEIVYSLKVVICFAIWSGESPEYCHTTVTTGMSISGKMSVGVFLIDVMPSNKISSAITTKVYGRRRANLTIHIRRERA